MGPKMANPIFTVKHDFLEGSPAFGTFLQEYAKLIKLGWARPFTAHTKHHKVLYAINPDGQVMGGIAYVLNFDTKMGWITFSFTPDEFRKMGVYTACHKALEIKLKEAGMLDIGSNVHIDNKVRQASCEKVGMKPEFIRMCKPLVY
jgi:RimJ/RimL family protein N-acetyltransferase